MKQVLGLFALFLVIAFGIVFARSYLETKNLSSFNKSPTVAIGDHKFQVKISDSQKEREIGLSETKSLSDNQGMIFLFEKPDYYSFWMKNMKFPIDIIYINDNRIVTIFENVNPPINLSENQDIYTSTESANKVLEIGAGLSAKYNFKKGDKVQYENLGN